MPVGDAFHQGGPFGAIAGRGQVGDGEIAGEDEAGILPGFHGEALAGENPQVERMDEGGPGAGGPHAYLDLAKQGGIIRVGRISGQSDADDSVRVGHFCGQQDVPPDRRWW